MRIIKDLDLVEQLGSGIHRILQFYEKDVFQFSENFLRIVLPSNVIENADQVGGQVGGQDTNVKELTKGQNQVFRLIEANPKISRRALAEKLKINQSAIPPLSQLITAPILIQL